MSGLEKLEVIAKGSKQAIICGIEKKRIQGLLENNNLLSQCIDDAYNMFTYVKTKYPSFSELSEQDKIIRIQESFVNFYSPETVNLYIPLAAKGPWIVTSCGAVIHDSGGYGMLGFGHNPNAIISSLLNDQHVMANIMTPNYAQYEFTRLLLDEIGHTRTNGYENSLQKFVCLNSGSEGVGLALRISDARALKVLEKNPDKICKFLTLQQSFHGRTDFPARVSSASLSVYKKHLASFQSRDDLLTVEINNVKDLESAFIKAEADNIFIQAVIFEPVMGEGNPGVGLSPEFYRVARRLTKEHGSSFIIDSIQAGLRTHGCLSIVDYPGFENEGGPDCEAYSKALNAGQYPLSVVAMTEEYATFYQPGMYGNTMTANPRALAVASAVLESLTPAVRENIRERGKEFLAEANKLKSEYHWLIEDVHGTGLLFCLAINKKVIDVVGFDGLENKVRKVGIGVIHGGENALRFTPWFGITSAEIKLICDKLREVFDTLR